MRYSVFATTLLLLAFIGSAGAQTLYNSQSGGGTGIYNSGSQPLNLKGMLQGNNNAGAQYMGTNRFSGGTRAPMGSSTYDERAQALAAYRAQRDSQAQFAYANEMASITQLSESVGTPAYNASPGFQTTAGQTNTDTIMSNGVPVRPIYRGADKPKTEMPKRIFNSVR